MPKPLRVNVDEYRFGNRYGEAVFYVRGLTVSEMIAINQQFESKQIPTASDFYNVGRVCLIGWDNLFEWIDGELYEIQCTDSNIEKYIDPQSISELGKYALAVLSYLSEEEENKYRGYVNMVFWLSDEKRGKSNRESLDCENCVRKSLIFSRPCGRKDKEQLIERIHGKREEKKEKPLSSFELAKKKFGIKNKLLKASKELSEEEKERKRKEQEEKARTMTLNGFKFPECPITWISSSQRTLADALWDCSKNSKTFFSDGVGGQPHKIYQIEKIIGSESSRLESEEIKKQTK